MTKTHRNLTILLWLLAVVAGVSLLVPRLRSRTVALPRHTEVGEFELLDQNARPVTRARKEAEVYWLPLSECQMAPGSITVVAAALRSACSTSSVRMWSATDQPTSRRLKQSITVARYRLVPSASGR